MKTILFISLSIFIDLVSYCQSIGINEDASAPNPSALLDIKSTTRGLLIPRMSSAQRKAIASPAAGLLVFDLDKSTIYLFDGQKWQPMLFSNSDGNNPSIARSALDGTALDRFANSASISGDYAIVGAYTEDVGVNTDQGAAYIFVRQDGAWSQQAKLVASDGAANDNFGNSVSISGDYAIVGAPKGSGEWLLQGAAYIFLRAGTSWSQQAKLNASDGVIGNYFGYSVSIDGDDVVVGDPRNYVQYASQGAAYIFVRNDVSWSQQGKLIYPGGMYNDQLGFSVSISGNYAIAGAPYFDWLGIDKGAAFIFIRTGTTWTWQERFDVANAAAADNIGVSVSISGDYAIVGSPYHDGEFVDEGSAYIFIRNGTSWNNQRELKASNNETSAHFGYTVSIDGDYAIVGAMYEDIRSSTGQQDAGAAYIFHRNAVEWDLIRSMLDGNRQPAGFFGSAIGVSGFNYIIGAFGKNNAQGEVNFLNIE